MLRKFALKFAKLLPLFVAQVPLPYQAASPLAPAINERNPPYPFDENRPCCALMLGAALAHLFIHRCDR
jgi:hypothetical protein